MSDTDTELDEQNAVDSASGAELGSGEADDSAADSSAADSSAADTGEGEAAEDSRGGDSLLIREGDIAADYLERLLDIADYDGDIDLDVENDRAAVAIVGGDLRSLVGGKGETLDALQELTRLAVQQQTGVRSRLMLDISGFRKQRRDELVELANETAGRVTESGQSARLRPMNPFERKVVHDAVSAIDGVTSESEGEEPHRRVVIVAAG